MDSVFLITIGVIFLSAIVGVYTRRRSRDACLNDFADFQVTMERVDGELTWGRLQVYSSGIELLYKSAHTDSQGHLETSYVVFADELPEIRAIYRYHDELAPERQAERAKEIEKSHHPGIFRRMGRGLRNFFNTFHDAFNQTFNAAMSQMKKGTSGAVLKSQNKNIASLGSDVLGAAENAYEPILERYIGHRVVVEERRGEELLEHAGILKEYSPGWIELLDCAHRSEHPFHLRSPEQLRINQELDFIVTRGSNAEVHVQVENHGTTQVFIKRLESGDWSEVVDAVLPPGGVADLSLGSAPENSQPSLNKAPQERFAFRAPGREETDESEIQITPDNVAALPNITLIVEAIREMDVCLPRSRSTLRHGGERVDG